MIRILLVDNHDGVRRSLSTALATVDDIAVVGAATCGSEAERLCARLMPDVVLMEILLPDEDGIGLVKRIRMRFPTIQVVVLTSAIAANLERRAVAEGACAYLRKYVAVDELTKVIHAAHDRRVLRSNAET